MPKIVRSEWFPEVCLVYFFPWPGRGWFVFFCEWKSISVSNVYQNNMNEGKQTYERMKPASTFVNKIYAILMHDWTAAYVHATHWGRKIMYWFNFVFRLSSIQFWSIPRWHASNDVKRDGWILSKLVRTTWSCAVSFTSPTSIHRLWAEVVSVYPWRMKCGQKHAIHSWMRGSMTVSETKWTGVRKETNTLQYNRLFV